MLEFRGLVETQNWNAMEIVLHKLNLVCSQ